MKRMLLLITVLALINTHTYGIFGFFNTRPESEEQIFNEAYDEAAQVTLAEAYGSEADLEFVRTLNQFDQCIMRIHDGDTNQREFDLSHDYIASLFID